jgi:hypothetical protein
MSDETPRPVLRIVRGEPSDAELAALLAVLAAGSGAPAAAAPEAPSAWRDRAALLRKPLHPGPGAWRASARRF